MAKPIIKTINPFDATQAYMVSFIWTGAMAYNNRMIIYDSDTQLPIYDNTYNENYYRLEHIIPEGTLDNGKKYAVAISVIDLNGEASEFSDKYYFWCMELPEFYFEDLIPEGQNYVYNSSYTATLHYEQADNVQLDTLQYYLYNSTHELVFKSDVIKYNGPDSLQYTYRSLDNNNYYYLRATGTNTKNVSVDTGEVLLIVTYINPSMYARFYARANTTIGTVDYYSNVVDIESDRPSEEYEFEEGYINLTAADPNRVLNIRNDGRYVSPMLTVQYYDLDNVVQSVTSNGDISISRYSYVSKLVGQGNSFYVSPRIIPQMGSSNYDLILGIIQNTDLWDLYADGYLIENVSSSISLKSIENVRDTLTLFPNGKRYLIKNVGTISMSESMEPVSSRNFINEYGHPCRTDYYDIGATGVYGTIAVFCDSIPVNKDNKNGTNIGIMQDGLLAMTWDFVELMALGIIEPRNWFSKYSTIIQFPLKQPQRIELDNIAMPDMRNINSVRYSHNFIIPDENATISLRMKDAFKTIEVLRLQTGTEDKVLLSSMVYDDNTLRYKLTIYGPSSDYVIYSNPFTFFRWDIVTVHIRRINGVYGLYVFVTEGEQDVSRNYWFLESGEPTRSDVNRGDVWINKNYTSSYIDKNSVVRYYQNDKPLDAREQNIWIGE